MSLLLAVQSSTIDCTVSAVTETAAAGVLGGSLSTSIDAVSEARANSALLAVVVLSATASAESLADAVVAESLSLAVDARGETSADGVMTAGSPEAALPPSGGSRRRNRKPPPLPKPRYIPWLDPDREPPMVPVGVGSPEPAAPAVVRLDAALGAPAASLPVVRVPMAPRVPSPPPVVDTEALEARIEALTAAVTPWVPDTEEDDEDAIAMLLLA